ncbi:MAG: glutamate dehydrogenase [Deferribacteres bacterium]|nr:glutamate dehydrogenase [Deferribacteres bacterium]
MYNITFSRDSEAEYKKNELYYENKIAEVFSQFKKTNEPFYNFSRIFVKNIPFNLIEIISNKDLLNLMQTMYEVLNNRKKKKYLQTIIEPYSNDFFIGNFAILIMNTDDRPFLVDSIREYFYEINLNQQFILHPIFSVKRNAKGEVIELDKPQIGTRNESFVAIFIEGIESDTLKEVADELNKIYDEVCLTVDDYSEMSSMLNNLSLYYKNKSAEVSEFLKWIGEGNFILQGIRVLNDINLSDETYKLEQYGVYKLNRTIGLIPNMIKALKNKSFRFINGYPVIFDKALYRSKVKKRKNYDRIIIVDDKGEQSTLVSMIGILSKDALKIPPYNISLVRHKIDEIIDHFGFVNGSHDHKWLLDMIESFPKTEIISLDKETLINIFKTVFSMQGKNQIVFYTKNFKPLKNYYVFMAFPQEKFSNEILQDIKKIFQKELNAHTLDISVRNDEHGYVFAHFHFYLKDLEILKKLDFNKIELQIAELIKDWKDELYEELKIRFSGVKSDQLFQKFADSFSETYKTKCTPHEAAEDISYLDKLIDVSANLYADSTKVTLKLYTRNKILLTDIMPIIDNIGIKVNEEFTYKVNTESGKYFINSIHLAEIDDAATFKEKYSKLLPELVLKVIKEKVENDNLNKLLILENLNYKEIDFLRGVRNYIEQINPLYRRASLNEAIINNSSIGKYFIDFLYEKFEPGKKSRNFEKIEKNILEAIDKVVSVQEDGILRHFYKVITAIIRTNYFIPGKDYISFKIKSKELDILPDPKPMFEIYVHSAQMEGIHLRGGKVARGGLRFSDRPDDFRTEILGLVKTQMVKNTVIVPVGSKGGFIVKKRYEDRELDKEHVINQYKTLIKGLLDITDNYKGKKIVHPENVVIYDEKDPYLVVAADKGTATFSDIANSVSIEYGFWLGDAFASGGSAGYDHKKVGITAKGAWESVKRHFRELGKDTQSEPFSVIGIGDMSGDVFGNGMLLSDKIKLLAAFNHIHIFVDPDPDPETSFVERLRMFKLPRSTWKDYNYELISKGGGIFERSAKKIELSPEIKEVFDIDKDVVTGEELIKYILKSRAELLWNGGIGTYIKDDSETNEEVGDKANDNVRINASELRVKVIGEGGNLGLTQKARIRFALNGGLINTDAIDNSAGVDMSDHEVNLKILFDVLMKNKELKDIKERNALIAKLTPEVTDLVLRDNYLQTQIISCDLLKAKKNLISYIDTAEYLKNIGLLNFKIEKINFINEKRNITRPELSVLLAYTKIMLFDNTVNEFNHNSELLKEEYIKYYPKTVIKKYSKYFDEHKLKNEITATVAVNKAVNQAGIPFFIELHKTTGQPYAKLIERYLYADKLLGTSEVREKVEALDLKVEANLQYQMLIELEKTLKVATNWLINDNNFAMINENMDTFKKVCNSITTSLKGIFKDNYDNLLCHLNNSGCKSGISKSVCDIKFVKPAFDLFEVIIKNNLDITKTVKNYFTIGLNLNLPLFINGVKQTEIKTTWDKTNRENLLNRIKIFQKEFCAKYTQNGEGWLKELQKTEQIFFMNYNKFLESISAGEFESLVPYNVMLDSLFNMLNTK